MLLFIIYSETSKITIKLQNFMDFFNPEIHFYKIYQRTFFLLQFFALYDAIFKFVDFLEV